MPINLLIVGHANTGKTSLIRTLIRDKGFGQVGNIAGTTRHVEAVDIKVERRSVLRLIDTPGFEDSIGLWDARQQPEYSGVTNYQWLETFPDTALGQQEFEQESKIIKQLINADIILYVIDSRQAPLGKYLDELNVLACANKPIIPILNFSHPATEQQDKWKSVLAERHHHAFVKYDTVAFFFEDEKRLYQTLQSLAPSQYDALQTLLDTRYEAAKQRLDEATKYVAEMLFACASKRIESALYPPEKNVQEAFENAVRSIEQSAILRLLSLYDFQKEDTLVNTLPIANNRWTQDLFSPESLTEWGLQAGTSAATGAAIGVSIDILSAGLSLGTATTIGALLGATWETGKHYKETIKSKITKKHLLCLQDATLTLLTFRAITLIRHLHQRGHASIEAYKLGMDVDDELKSLTSELPTLWKAIRQRSEQNVIQSSKNQKLIAELKSELKVYVTLD
ncbi:GTPase/DUF3482 domain-containing protein [Marinomonas mediterranea]|jgi:Predicted GTPase|uniref:GTP-binding protein HSR1-related protein n=1 Tax=Marinomonas mediterranea (strain ATCC 700492 / JCM 21426 / NBRC 103028 / MMB-1) TaxID=717774 RepID=F2JZK4_MARM1|nr:GTPase/DUF3482 domain-containing protein [Marinomonas mediterranea]ADZ89787.1 GTP-binding protein HSR1-related protein [Marinomonas mediterranea MMB-1]WCN16009.1 DUF3482 domain-containing protein [Marinomonas mediterranea MMB-1]